MIGWLFSLLPKPYQKRIIQLLEDYRGLVIVFFCLPASFVFDSVLQLRKWVYVKFLSAPKEHDARVTRIQNQVKSWRQLPGSQRRLLCTARPNWLSLSLTFFPKHEYHRVAVPLYDVLGVDVQRGIIRVEPMVTVAQATDYLLPLGYVLEVCLEIADATLGGLAMGVGMTTHSHKVGLYQESIVSYDMVLGDGQLVHVTADNEHSQLFHCLPWSHGSLGFLVAMELRIIPAKPYIRLHYQPLRGSQKHYCDRLRQACGALGPDVSDKEIADYVEMTVFSRDDAVLMTGQFASEEEVHRGEFQVNHLARWYKPWFYKYVEFIMHRHAQGYTEFVPIKDYLLRHNRAIFWVLEAMIPFGNAWWFRWPMGWLCPPKPAFLKFTTTPGVRAMTFVKQVFQDITLPMTVLEQSIDLSEQLFDTYPILLYPCRVYDHGAANKGQLRPPRADQMCPNTNWGMFFDLGVYGIPGPVRRKEPYNPISAYRQMEKFIRDVGGYPFLYADIFMTRDEFEETFDLTAYEKVRRECHAEGAFPHLYEKVKPEIDVFAIGKAFAEETGALKKQE